MKKGCEESGLKRDFEDEFNRNCKDDNCFEGPVSITNWTITRRQKIVQDTSFESEAFDIYDPQFSSSQSVSETREVGNRVENVESGSDSILTVSPEKKSEIDCLLSMSPSVIL